MSEFEQSFDEVLEDFDGQVEELIQRLGELPEEQRMTLTLLTIVRMAHQLSHSYFEAMGLLQEAQHYLRELVIPSQLELCEEEEEEDAGFC